MAVDVGALIAESIDSYYVSSTTEWQSWIKEQYDQLIERVRNNVLSETFNPKYKGHPDYRSGYKSGWKRHQDGGDATPPPADQLKTPVKDYNAYSAGFVDGHGGSTKGQEILNTAKTDPAAAKRAAIKHFVNPYFENHIQNAFAKNPDYLDTDKAEAEQAWYMDNSGEHAMHLINKYNENAHLDDAAHVDDDTSHPGDIHDELGRMSRGAHPYLALRKQTAEKKARAAAEAAGVGHTSLSTGTGRGVHTDRAPLMAYKENLEQDLFGPAAVNSHNRHRASGGRDGRHDPIIQEFRNRDHSVPGEGVDPERHDGHAAAQQHAHDIWKRSIIGQLDDLAQAPESGDWALQPLGLPALQPHPEHDGFLHAPNTADASVKFDPVQYVKDRMDHGWYVRGSDVAARQKQLPDYHSPKKFKDSGGQTVMVRHPHEGKLNGALTSLKNWLNGMVPEFAPDHEMWGHHDGLHQIAKGNELDYLNPPDRRLPVGGVRARELKKLAGHKIKLDPSKVAQRGERGAHNKRRRVPAPEEVVDWVLNIVGNWLQEHVSLDESLLPAIKEDIYSRVQSTYGHLFEVEFSV